MGSRPARARCDDDRAAQDTGKGPIHDVVVGGTRRAYWGLAAGFVIALAFLIASVILGLNGHDTLRACLACVLVHWTAQTISPISYST